MKITKVFRKDLGAHRWKIDITIDGKRIRRIEFMEGGFKGRGRRLTGQPIPSYSLRRKNRPQPILSAKKSTVKEKPDQSDSGFCCLSFGLPELGLGPPRLRTGRPSARHKTFCGVRASIYASASLRLIPASLSAAASALLKFMFVIFIFFPQWILHP